MVAEWREQCQGRLVSPEEAVAGIRPGQRVAFGHCPYPASLWAIMEALARRKDELPGAVVSMTVSPPAPWHDPGWTSSFEVWDSFGYRWMREATIRGQVQFTPDIFSLRHPQRLLEPGRASLALGADWAVVAVTPPDRHGYLSFGHVVCGNPSLAGTAQKVIAVVHPHLPWTYGEVIHLDRIDCLVEYKPPPPERIFALPPMPEDEAQAAQVIAALASDLIRDGDTIQIGAGGPGQLLPEFLTARNDLGIHTEMLTPEILLDLIKAGVATGRRKNLHPGLAMGNHVIVRRDDPRLQEAMDYIDRNPAVELRDLSYINDPMVIASNDNMVAANVALALDLRGQVAVDCLGLTPMAGLGGQLDFVIASHYSQGGRSITLLLSTAQGGQASRIVPRFPAGAPVSIPCVYVDYLVTEHGAVNLEGRTPRQRAEAIISIAHPDFQPELRKAAREMFYP